MLPRMSTVPSGTCRHTRVVPAAGANAHELTPLRPQIPGCDCRLGCHGHAGGSRSRSQGDGTNGECRGRGVGLRQILGSVGLSLPLLSAGATSAAEGDGPGPPQDVPDADTGADEVGVGRALLMQFASPVNASQGVLNMPEGSSPHA